MQAITNQIELQEKLSIGVSLVYVHTEHCGVCIADLPRVEGLAERLQIPAYSINPEEMPLLRGQWSLFTAPVVLLFLDGKEMHRQARIIDFKELEYRILQLKEA